jgi:hypothetical protein
VHQLKDDNNILRRERDQAETRARGAERKLKAQAAASGGGGGGGGGGGAAVGSEVNGVGNAAVVQNERQEGKRGKAPAGPDSDDDF